MLFFIFRWLNVLNIGGDFFQKTHYNNDSARFYMSGILDLGPETS